jgi:hypothetical protein
MIFEPTWISTAEHLAKFKTITADTTAAIKRGGRYEVPDDFPQTRIAIYWGLMYSSPSPLIMLSNGVLNLSDDSLSYKASPLRMANNKVSNLQDNLEFSIPKSDIASLARYQFVSPINNNFDISFTRVCTTHDGLLHDFLVCVGGQGLAFEKIRKANVEIFNSLAKIMGTQIISTFQ